MKFKHNNSNCFVFFLDPKRSFPSYPPPRQTNNFKFNNFSSKKILTIEVLVAIDQSMIAYHEKHNLEEYALTLMSIASDKFADLNINYSIRLAVTDIIFIEENLKFQHATKINSFDYFGKFQQPFID